MKIAQVVPYSHKSFGGHEYYLSKVLSELGHEVTLFTSNKIPPRYGQKEIINKDSEKFEIRRFHPLIDVKEVPVMPQIFSSLCKTDLDVIHVHEYFQICSLFGALASKVMKIPLVLTQHGYYYPKKLTKRAAIKFSENSFSRFTLRWTKKIIAISKATENFLVKNVGIDDKMIEVIPTGIDTSRFSHNMKDNLLFGDLSGKKIVLFVGRLVEQKGVDSLIKAFRNLSKDRPNLLLCVVGDGPMKPYLHRLSLKLNIMDKILWFNYVQHDIIPRLYASSTVFVLPSSIEPLGIAILEAMASGKPVIATKVGGIPDIISDGVNGILVEPNNVPALESALRVLLYKEKLAKKMGEEGRRLAERKFSWEIIGKKIVSIYEQAIHESSSGKKRVD